MEKFESLRTKYPRFVYKNYSYRIKNRDLEISFSFSIEKGINFIPKIIIKNINKVRLKHINKRVLNNLIFHLGLIESLSYWKATCSPEIEIKAGYLDKFQMKWWRDLIFRGMGQFFYENKINYRTSDFIKIKSNNDHKDKKDKNNFQKYQLELKKRILLPLGGGKDSIVSLEVLKKHKEINLFSLNPNLAAKKIVEIAGVKNPVFVERKIDDKLLELNRKGFLNGHTPFSAYLAFLSVFLAVIFDYKYVVFSNERSSNEGNIKYLKKFINHQYSKSFEFEKKFRKYSQKFLTDKIMYFSFLRPLYEIQIAKLFSKYKHYFPVFLSCNEASKTYSGRKIPTGKWCGSCPKCLFVYACLYPFINKLLLEEIFGENIYKRINLIPMMEELIGEKDFKPFECVGTKRESLVAFYLSWKKGQQGREPRFLLRHFEKKILPRYPKLEKETEKIMNSWNKKNNLPKDFKKILKDYVLTEKFNLIQ